MKYRYVLLTNKYDSAESYGIAAVADYDGCVSILESYADLSVTRERVERLVELCNNLQLDFAHLSNAVEDFLANS